VDDTSAPLSNVESFSTTVYPQLINPSPKFLMVDRRIKAARFPAVLHSLCIGQDSIHSPGYQTDLPYLICKPSCQHTFRESRSAPSRSNSVDVTGEISGTSRIHWSRSTGDFSLRDKAHPAEKVGQRWCLGNPGRSRVGRPGFNGCRKASGIDRTCDQSLFSIRYQYRF
jgi:hypothetical protein